MELHYPNVCLPHPQSSFKTASPDGRPVTSLLTTFKPSRSKTYCLCLVAQSYPTLCDPLDCSPPGSSVHGILQARTSEWVAVPSPRGSSGPKDRIYIFCLLRWQAGSLSRVPPGMQEKKLIPFSTSGNWNTHCVPGTSTSWLPK